MYPLFLKNCKSHSNRIEIVDFSVRVTLKFHGWKMIGHLFYSTPSCVHHFKFISKFKLKLQSGNGKFGRWKCAFFCLVLPWNSMTSENNGALFPYHIKHCASFQSHGRIQTWLTVRIRSIWVKNGRFFSYRTLTLGEWTWETIGHLFYVASNSVYHFIAVRDLKTE